MNYIYDIYLNLNKILYDFFDWNKNDNFIHIKKIPIFKVNENTLKSFIQNNIIIEQNILSQIYKKCDIFNSKRKIDYCSLFCDNNNILAIEFNKTGESINKSFLKVEDELDIVEIIEKFNEKHLSFDIIKKDKSLFKTRKEIKYENFIMNSLRNIEDNKLNYIFFECFGYQEKNKKIMVETIKNLDKNSKIYKKLYYILKFTSTTKK